MLPDWDAFRTIRKENFDSDRGPYFHYALFGYELGGGFGSGSAKGICCSRGKDVVLGLKESTGVGVNDGVLYIVGTAAADEVSANDFKKEWLKVHATFMPEDFRAFRIAEVDKIVAYLREGDDEFTIARHVSTPAIIHGGADNDLLHAGGGPVALSVAGFGLPKKA